MNISPDVLSFFAEAPDARALIGSLEERLKEDTKSPYISCPLDTQGGQRIASYNLWRCGSPCFPHDHGAFSGYIKCVEGQVEHTHYVDFPYTQGRKHILAQGDLCHLPREAIHSMMATGGTYALTLHIYAKDVQEYDPYGFSLYDATGRYVLPYCSTSVRPRHLLECLVYQRHASVIGEALPFDVARVQNNLTLATLPCAEEFLGPQSFGFIKALKGGVLYCDASGPLWVMPVGGAVHLWASHETILSPQCGQWVDGRFHFSSADDEECYLFFVCPRQDPVLVSLIPFAS